MLMLIIQAVWFHVHEEWQWDI